LLSRIFEEVPRTVNELIVFMLFVWIVFGGIETGLRRSE
jgi:ABC-type phosphate/phosphonate transport system permease subunit